MQFQIQGCPEYDRRYRYGGLARTRGRQSSSFRIYAPLRTSRMNLASF